MYIFYGFKVFFVQKYLLFKVFAVHKEMFSILRYNFGRASIFMGDNGSTFIGLVLSVLFFQLLQLQGTQGNVLPMALSLIAIPVMDLLRVFLFRLSKGKPPHIGDRSHIHYIMMRKLVLPERVCFFLIGFNLLLIGLLWNFSNAIPVTEGIFLTLGSIWGIAIVGDSWGNLKWFSAKTNKEQVNEI